MRIRTTLAAVAAAGMVALAGCGDDSSDPAAMSPEEQREYFEQRSEEVTEKSREAAERIANGEDPEKVQQQLEAELAELQKEAREVIEESGGELPEGAELPEVTSLPSP